MKYFAIVILPRATDVTSTEAVERAAADLMRPFKIWDEDGDIPPGHIGCWDYFWCCSKEWMEQSGITFEEYGEKPEGQQNIVFAVEQINADGVTDSIVTPGGEWHRSNSTYAWDDPAWSAEALGILRDHAGHYGVLAYCHG